MSNKFQSQFFFSIFFDHFMIISRFREFSGTISARGNTKKKTKIYIQRFTE